MPPRCTGVYDIRPPSPRLRFIDARGVHMAVLLRVGGHEDVLRDGLELLWGGVRLL